MCMIGASEQKLCPAGDRAKFSNDKFVMVDRIVVQYIVLLKLPWVWTKSLYMVKSPTRMLGFLMTFFRYTVAWSLVRG